MKPADVAAVVEQFQHASPWRTALDTEPVWLAGKRAALERDVLPCAEIKFRAKVHAIFLHRFYQESRAAAGHGLSGRDRWRVAHRRMHLALYRSIVTLCH